MKNLIESALATGAIGNGNGRCAAALAELAKYKPEAAKQWASTERTPRERAELAISIEAPRTTFAQTCDVLRRMGNKNPEAALLATYGA